MPKSAHICGNSFIYPNKISNQVTFVLKKDSKDTLFTRRSIKYLSYIFFNPLQFSHGHCATSSLPACCAPSSIRTQ